MSRPALILLSLLAGCVPALPQRECFGDEDCPDRVCRAGACAEAPADAGGPVDAAAPDAEAMDGSAADARADAAADSGLFPDSGLDDAEVPDAEAPDAEADAGEPPGRAPGAVVDYLFDEGSGSTVRDMSGFGAPLDLTIAPPAARWIPGGLRIEQPTIIESSGIATKVRDECATSEAVTIEAWAGTSTRAQGGPARIFTLSETASFVDLLLGQGGNSVTLGAFVSGRVQTTTGNSSAVNIELRSTEELMDAPTHLVLVRPRTRELHLYVDLQVVTSSPGGTFDWNDTSRIKVGNDYSSGVLDRPWLGSIYRAAIYCRALSAAEVLQNYQAGP